MLPKNLVLDEVATTKDFAELIELVETTHRVHHEHTTLESIDLRPDGTVRTPAGEWRVTREFLEGCALAIGMPLAYAYKVTPELFYENFVKRQSEATAPITISRIGDVATGLVLDRKCRYRPACTGDVLRAVRRAFDLELRRASISFAGVDVELVWPGSVVEPVVGDVLEVGLALTNSESGGRQLKASAYSHRLVCTNGSIMADQLGIARWPNDPRMTDAGCLRKFENSLEAMRGSLESVAALYSMAVDRQFPDDELWNLWRRVAYLLPQSEADEVLGFSGDERRDLQEVIRQRGSLEPALMTQRNAYEIHNRITHAAHDRPFHIHRGLQEVGGDLLSRAATWLPAVSVN